MDYQYLSQFELRQICYFLALVKAENNFTEAAKRLGIKQPPLTQRIQALEKLLSEGQNPHPVKLLDRSKRPIALTEAGEVFLAEAKQAIAHLDRAILRSQQASQGQIGRLVIGITNVMANSILPDVVQSFHQRFPTVVLEMREVTVEEQLSMLRTKQIDITFQQAERFDESDSDLIFQPILQEYFILAIPANHPLAAQSKVALTALKDEQIILPSFDVFPFYQSVILLCQRAGFEPKISQTVVASGAITLLSLVAAGVGVSILPNHVQTLSREGVVYRSLQDTGLTRQVAVVWRSDDSSIVLRQFLNVIQELMNLSVLDTW
jgi:DNA-binding transcriptional LysR family regulator